MGKTTHLEQQGWTGATRNWKNFHWFLQMLIIIAGLLVILSSGFAIYRSVAIHQRYYPLVKASMEMQLAATVAYLWLEEMIGGDKTKTLNDILTRLNVAHGYTVLMLAGGKNTEFALPPLSDSQLYATIVGLQAQLSRQRQLLIQRTRVETDAGPGSGIDQRYHSMLQAFLVDAGAFENQVEGLIEKNYRVSKTINIGVIGFIILLFLILGISFFSYENLRRKNVAEIVDMHRMLVQQEKMAALGTMMAGIAHEVNNPNSFISMNLPLLEGYIADILPIVDGYARARNDWQVANQPYHQFRENLLQTLTHIGNGADRINRFTSTLLHFSRHEREKTPLWINVAETIESVIDISRSKLKRSAIELSVDIDAAVPETIFFDPEVLEITLLNLLNNAADAADKPAPWIALDVRPNPASRNRSIVIEVRDNGSGIREADMRKIFEPFFSTKSPDGGTGLGLYLCYTLLDQAGAKIAVESEVGAGSVFRLTL
jgi:signal transduction histidine kinase